MFGPRGKRGLAPAVLLCALALTGCAATAPGGDTNTPTSGPPAAMIGAALGDVDLSDGAGPPAPATRVEFVIPGLPADLAGVREGDIIAAFAGKPMHSNGELIAAIGEQQPGEKVTLTVLRNGERLDLAVSPTARPADYATPGGSLNRYYAARVQSERQAAVIEQQAGHPREALAHDALAIRLLLMEERSFRTPVTDAIDGTVRHIATLLPKLHQPPPVPHEAARRTRLAIATVRSASDARGFDAAGIAFVGAIYEAPWLAGLYRDAGLTFAEAGSTETAILHLRRYLVLDPSAPDAAIVKRKLDELAAVADDRRPWLRFATTWNAPKGGTERISFRGRHLLLSVVTPNPVMQQSAGDPVCWGEIRGQRFAGLCNVWYEKDAAAECFGPRRDYPATGWLTADGSLVIDTVTNVNYRTESCTIDSESTGHYRWLHVKN